jgi:opacity protein-like surface antigen
MIMRNYLFLATAAAAIATPAFAAADGPYVGVEGGISIPNSTNYDVTLTNNTASPTTTTTYDNGYRVKYKKGYDVDLLAGYKLGLFRLEAEGGYQRAKVKGLTVSSPMITDVGTATATTVTASNFDVGNHIGVTKLMANALIDSDFGGGFGGYAGGGVGRAWTKFSGDKDNAWAYQGIAGLRYALSPNIDAGVKYEYFRTGKLNYDDAFAVNGTSYTSTAKGHYASNNVLASLVYNFNSREAPAPEAAAAPAPPPPPPAAPATQTCPDGSVILATSTCPAPPAPPPPPPPAQRGERG